MRHGKRHGKDTGANDWDTIRPSSTNSTINQILTRIDQIDHTAEKTGLAVKPGISFPSYSISRDHGCLRQPPLDQKNGFLSTKHRLPS